MSEISEKDVTLGNQDKPSKVKTFAEFIPIAIFIALIIMVKKGIIPNAEGKSSLYIPTISLMITMPITFAIVWLVEKKLPVVLFISSMLIIIFGLLTIVFNSNSFIIMKPSILYVLMAAGLLIGLALKKLFLKSMLGSSIVMDESLWRVLTIRVSVFLVLMAIANLLIGFYASETIWGFSKFLFVILFTIFITWQVLALNPNFMKEAEHLKSKNNSD